MPKKSYIGKLIAANPLNPKDSLNHSVVLIVTHTDEVCYGLQINKPMQTMTVADISDQVGIYVPSQDPIYIGGGSQPNKIHVVHSNDWAGLTTVKVNDEISVTNDISVLAALSRGEGPEYFKACAGFCYWDAEQLMEQIEAKSDVRVKHRWEYVAASLDNVFDSGNNLDHWHKVIEEAARHQVSAWF